MNATGNTLLIRADASPEIGTGHVMRCLSLVQGWKERGGAALFACSQNIPGLVRRLKAEDIVALPLVAEAGATVDADETIRIARERNAAWVVVDGYHFGEDYQDYLKKAGLKVLFIDDYGCGTRCSADILLNQNLYADESFYLNRGASTRYLLGCRYSLLRREFARYRGRERRDTARASRILVTLGGADQQNITGLILDALTALPEHEQLNVKVMVGPAYTTADLLKRQAGAGGLRCDILRDVSVMSEWMDWADLAITAAGSTCWELCFMGLPAIVITMADNQIRVADSLAAAGIASAAGWYSSLNQGSLAAQISGLLSDAVHRREMSSNGWLAVDGFGVDRLCAVLCGEKRLLREATWRDCRLLWEWANDPVTRAMSISTKPIPYDEHEAWFRRKMSGCNTTILILEYEGTPVGQIRFDLKEDGVAEIDFYVAAALRGQSLGTYLLQAGTDLLFKKEGSRITRVEGVVRADNDASCRSFEKAGFRAVGQEVLCGQGYVRFERGEVS